MYASISTPIECASVRAKYINDPVNREFLGDISLMFGGTVSVYLTVDDAEHLSTLLRIAINNAKSVALNNARKDLDNA